MYYKYTLITFKMFDKNYNIHSSLAYLSQVVAWLSEKQYAQFIVLYFFVRLLMTGQYIFFIYIFFTMGRNYNILIYTGRVNDCIKNILK